MTESYLDALIKLPSDFGYYGDLPVGDTWTLGPVIRHRDSGPLDESNAAAIVARFTELFGPEGEDQGWEVTRCGHWAVGWVEHLSFRVRGEDGAATPQVRAWAELEWRMEAYPVLDDDDFSEREHEALIEYLESATRGSWLRDDVPDSWACDLAAVVYDRVHHDSTGPYVRDADIRSALAELGYLAPDDE
jgi:hypothetical protein